ncbi:MAG: transcriptional repressor [Opitutales bacterium]|nr:transcriptional repressor [Opitutales bacterium]
MNNKIFRETKQRNAIKRAIESAGRPVGPKEILELACGEVPNLGIATVYRNIKTMVEKGELDPVDLPGQAPRYQPPSEKKPHLFICEKTDRVFTIDPKAADFKPALPEGFVLDRFQIICYGEYKG